MTLNPSECHGMSAYWQKVWSSTLKNTKAETLTPLSTSESLETETPKDDE